MSQDLLDPDEGIVKFCIYGLQVFETQGFVQNTLVERQGEACVDEFTMEQGLERKRQDISLSAEEICQH